MVECANLTPPPPKDQTWWLPQQRIGTPALDIYVVQTPEAFCSKGAEATWKSYRSSNHCKWVQLCPHESKTVSKPVPPWIGWWYILSYKNEGLSRKIDNFKRIHPSKRTYPLKIDGWSRCNLPLRWSCFGWHSLIFGVCKCYTDAWNKSILLGLFCCGDFLWKETMVNHHHHQKTPCGRMFMEPCSNHPSEQILRISYITNQEGQNRWQETAKTCSKGSKSKVFFCRGSDRYMTFTTKTACVVVSVFHDGWPKTRVHPRLVDFGFFGFGWDPWFHLPCKVLGPGMMYVPESSNPFESSKSLAKFGEIWWNVIPFCQKNLWCPGLKVEHFLSELR